MSEPDNVTALARKWCPRHSRNIMNPARLYTFCICPRLAAAVREALEEAEKLHSRLLALTRVEERGHGRKSYHIDPVEVIPVIDAIAALREGRDA